MFSLRSPIRRVRLRGSRLDARTPARSLLSRQRSKLLGFFERLEPRRLLHADAISDAEHLAVFGSLDPATQIVTGGLVPDAAVTTRAIRGGNWSDSSTWSAGVPGANANVLVPQGLTVTVDGMENAARLRTIRVDGTLTFDTTVNTSLWVDTIIVERSGTFQIGTLGQPVDANVTATVVFADRGPIDLAWDPKQFSRGLVSHGNVSIYGQQVTSFVPAAGDLARGTTEIVVGLTPTGWNVGDHLVISGNTATDSQNRNQDEERVIAAIHGNVVTLGAIDAQGHAVKDASGNYLLAPLLYDHTTPKGLEVPGVYVADLTRNVVFTSENTIDIAQRGHVMFMHNPNVHIAGAGFYGLGRTNKLVPIEDTGSNMRGRYSIHFHRMGNDPNSLPATVSDVAVVDNPGWAITNHSSYVDVSGSVVFNAVGAAYATEAGDEIGSFTGNMAIHSRGSGDANASTRINVQDFGHQGHGFWLQGGNVRVTDNVVTGQRSTAYIIFAKGLLEPGLGFRTIPVSTLADPTIAPPGATTIPVGQVPLREFKNNVAFGVYDGFESHWLMFDALPSNHGWSVVENFTVAGTSGAGVYGKGMELVYTHQMTLKNVTVLGDLASPHGTGVSRNEDTRTIMYDHVHAEGWDIGINVPIHGANVIRAGIFNNKRNLYIAPSTNPIIGAMADSPPRTVDIVDDPSDPINGTVQFVDNLAQSRIVNGVPTQVPVAQMDIFLDPIFSPAFQDITKALNTDLIRVSFGTYQNMQLYFPQQTPTYIPFPSTTATSNGAPVAGDYVPARLLDKTNQALWNEYKLAVEGMVAPAGATASNPRINGLLGPRAAYPTEVRLVRNRYVTNRDNDFRLAYAYYDPGNPSADAQGYVTVQETQVTPLEKGWNFLTRSVAGMDRTFLVYNDLESPSFTPRSNSPTSVRQTDLDSGATFILWGTIKDDSYGNLTSGVAAKLNDPKYFSTVKTRPDGSRYVTLSFTIKDIVGNQALVAIDLTVLP